MKTLSYKDKEEWLKGRLGKITGTRLKEVVTLRGNGKKIGYYELIAERLGIPADDESAMDRGARLEAEAMERFVAETKKKVNTDLVIWTRDDNENIALSPDGFIGKTEAVEVKCLSSARHIEALLTQEVPSDYEYQVLQYFIVNDALKTLYFVFYDPRLLAKPFFFLTVNRKDLEEKIAQFLEYQVNILAEVEAAVIKISF